MEPFLISCPSCKIRLQITNPDFIGREFACPKCKTRLEVKEPTAEERAAAAKSDSTSSETGHVTGSFRLGPPKNLSQDAITAIGEFADIESILTTGAAKPTGKWINQPVANPQPSSEPAHDPAAEHRAAQQRWTWLIFSIVGGTLAALMVTSLVIYALSTNGQKRDLAQKPVDKGEVKQPENEKKETPPQPETDPGDGKEPNEKPNEQEPKVILPTDEPPPESDPKTNPENPTPPAVEPSKEPKSETPAAPSDFKPNEEKTTPRKTSIADAIKGTLENPSLLTPNADSQLRKAQGGLLAMPEIDPTVMKPKPQLLNVAQLLSETIEVVRADKLPLVDFIDLLSQLSGIPVSIDPVVIVRGGVDPRAEVSVVAEGQTLRQVGETALRPLGLSLIELGGGLVVAFPENAPPPALDLGGITIPAARTATFEKFICASIDSNRWGVPPTGATLSIANNQIKFQGSPRIALAVKKLLDEARAASGGHVGLLPTDDLLKKPIDFKDARPLRLDDLTSKLEKIAGCDIRIDWVSLGAFGWSQETTLSLSAQNEPLGDVLRKICEPRAWGFRQLTPSVIEITTFLETYEGAESRIVSIKKQLDAGMTPEKIQADLAKAIAPAIPKTADPLSFIQTLREPAIASIRGPASVQGLAEAWLNAPTDSKPAGTQPSTPPPADSSAPTT